MLESCLLLKVDRVQTKLTQADAGRALTMTLVDTLKSAQNDLRRAHGQLAQRYIVFVPH